MRRFRTLKIPAHCHPLVRRLTEEQNSQRLGDQDLAKRAGLSASTIKQWRYRRSPTIENLEAVFNVLGLELFVKYRRGIGNDD